MNCVTFSSVATDLAREQMMEANTRAAALEHAAVCEPCALRLAGERSLSAGLRALAASMQDVQASGAVEENLMAAFRATQSGRADDLRASATARGRNWSRWALAAAAMLLVALGVRFIPAGSRLLFGDGPDVKSPAVRKDSAGQKDAGSVESGSTTVAGVTDDSISNEPPRRYKVPRSLARKLLNSAPEGEFVTEFIPVSYSQTLPPFEGGKIVRVEMPRSALAALGIPVNAERMGARIRADVLVGDDGLARAIRFVR